MLSGLRIPASGSDLLVAVKAVAAGHRVNGVLTPRRARPKLLLSRRSAFLGEPE
jgi:hypothetical protein